MTTLYDQVKGLVRFGPRISGQPEVLHDIEDMCRANTSIPIVMDQIKMILELVPATFPEDWKSPDSYEELPPDQQTAYQEIGQNGLTCCPGPVIECVIRYAVAYRKAYGA